MRNFVIVCLVLICISAITVIKNNEVVELRKEVVQLRMLKTHFYEFRNNIYMTVPIDYLSKVTIDDFDFDKYLEE